MKHSLQLLFLFLSFSSYGETKNYEIESILLDCLTESYKEKQVDISKELDELENYLIESKSLKSSSGQSYFDFYIKIVQLNDIPAALIYDRFESIYKLSPNALYKVECLENLKGINSTIIANSKYNQMTIAIQRAASEGISLSNIAKALTSVLSPSDFDHPYYRAVALLTIAYSSNLDNGLLMQLKSNETQDFNEYEIITIKATEKNQIVLNGKPVSQEELNRNLVVFIQTNKSNHLIQFQADKGTSYVFYRQIQEQITTIYNEMRNELAIKQFKRPFNELTENQQNEIIQLYPIRIKE